MENTGRSGRQGGAVMSRTESLPRGFDADQPHVRIVEKSAEYSHRVRSSSDARDDRMGEPAIAFQHLSPSLAPDDGLKVPYHSGEGIRTHHRTDDVMRGRHIGDPIPERLVRGVF